MILRKGFLIAQIGFQVSNLVRNDSQEACLEVPKPQKGWLKLAWKGQQLE
jgi:hypothetical protein